MRRQVEWLRSNALPAQRRAICLRVKPSEVSPEEITERLARATAVLMRISERLEANDLTDTQPTTEQADELSTPAAAPLPGDA